MKEKCMVNQRLLGGVLIAASLMLLTASGGLALSAILAPLSILVGYAILRAGTTNNKLPASGKRR
jgi:hypothetical protein